MAKLVVGCGYLGLRVARRWRDAGETVFAVTRSATRGDEFAAQGLSPIVADILRPDTLNCLPAAGTVLFAVGYDGAAGNSIEEVYVQGLRHVLAALPRETGRLIYISSTGVYGDFGGAWVDEDSPCDPDRPGGRACLAAEHALAAHPLAASSIVLRLAGIYGPGRVPRRAALMSGEPLAAPADGWLNLIHVDDAASAVLAAERSLHAPRRYLVSDGNPPRRRDYYRELARLLGAPEPRFAQPDAAHPATARAASDKRISNTRVVAELGLQFMYPTFREGLAAIVADE